MVTLVDETHPDAQLYASLAASFPGQMVDFASHTEDGKLIVVSVYSDTNPGELYLYNRDTGKARFLMQGRKWLDKDAMASTKPFTFTSRDGKRIHRSEEHKSELQSLMRISYAVFCLKKKNN